MAICIDYGRRFVLTTGGDLCTLKVANLCSVGMAILCSVRVWGGVVLYGGGTSIWSGGDA